MGNCQAIDAASLVIQHPSGRVERLYWPVTASEVMRTNPGHYVALIITLCLPEEEVKRENNDVRITRVKLLRPTDTLVLGQAYRLIDTQEVMKGLWAKKYAKMKKKELAAAEKSQREATEKSQRASEKQGERCEKEARTRESEKAAKQERHRQRTTPSTLARSKPWRPSLQSISEAGS